MSDDYNLAIERVNGNSFRDVSSMPGILLVRLNN
jgi:hypothetical protein